MVSAGFAPWRVGPHIDSSSDQVLQIYLSHTEKKRQYCVHDETKHVYFSLFNPLMVTDELEIESLGWVHGGELSMGRNRYKPCKFRSLYAVSMMIEIKVAVALNYSFECY